MIKRADANQPQLIRSIRKLPGVSVFLTHTVGKGFVDAVIGFRGVNYLVEIKDPGKSKSRKKLTPDEETFHRNWTGQVAVVETLEDVLKLLNL
jgi:hypothetical protein